tara:strand:- start:13 stop:456 length:444 start_codon:yes stop_codon:yes gene_type:complete
MSKNIYFGRKKLIIFVSIFCGILSVLANLFINYDISFSRENKKAYEIKEKISNYPEPIILFAEKQIQSLNDNEITSVETWLDNNKNSKSRIEIRHNKIYLSILTDNEFILSKYIKKLYLIPNIEIKAVSLSFAKNEINIILGNIASL